MKDNIMIGVGAGYSEIDMEFDTPGFFFYNNGHTGGRFRFSGYCRNADLYGYGSCVILADSLVTDRLFVFNKSIADFRVRSDAYFSF